MNKYEKRGMCTVVAFLFLYMEFGEVFLYFRRDDTERSPVVIYFIVFVVFWKLTMNGRWDFVISCQNISRNSYH